MPLTCNTTDIMAVYAEADQLPSEHKYVFLLRTLFLVVGLVFNVWILGVSWGATRIKGVFKYPLCNLAAWDIVYASVALLQMNVVLPIEVIVFMNNHMWLCTLGYMGNYLGLMGMATALIGCPLQRLLIFYKNLRFSASALDPTANLRFIVVTAAVSVLPTLATFYGPHTGCLQSFCGEIPAFHLGPLVLYGLAVTSYLIAIITMVMVVVKIFKIRQNYSKEHRAKAWREHREILSVIVLQTLNPILLNIPVVSYGVMFGLKSRFESSVWQKLAMGLGQLNPVLDAVSTTYSIKDYRVLVKRAVGANESSVTPVGAIKR